MQTAPNVPYIYQPGAIDDPSSPRIFGIPDGK